MPLRSTHGPWDSGRCHDTLQSIPEVVGNVRICPDMSAKSKKTQGSRDRPYPSVRNPLIDS